MGTTVEGLLVKTVEIGFCFLISSSLSVRIQELSTCGSGDVRFCVGSPQFSVGVYIVGGVDYRFDDCLRSSVGKAASHFFNLL